MGTSGDWYEIALEMRKAPGGDPWKAPREKLRRLLELAKQDGAMAIRSFESVLGQAVIEDLIADLMATKMREIIDHPDPRGCFFVALKRRAISYKRKESSRIEEAPSDDVGQGDERDPSSDRAFHKDALAVLASLSSRDRAVVTAVAAGEDRDEVARAFRTSRANVDQIVSRARKTFREKGT